MFKNITALLMITLGSFTFCQVGIGTENPHPSSELDLGASDKALYLNRVANTTVIANPQPGMMIYDLSEHCVKVFESDPAVWSECLGGKVGSITALTCGSAAFNPTSATVNTAYTGKLTIPYTGGNGGAYEAQSFTVNGLTFTLTAGNFNTGTGNLEYNITGTPTTAGTTSVNVTIGGQSCNGLTLPVITPAPTNPVGAGSLYGRICFDVVEQFISNECGTIAARTPQKADFSQTATNTQTYSFKPSGTVSNVRFMYFNAHGQVIQSITPNADYSGTLTAAQTATATVKFYNNLNAAATGLSRENALLGDIFVVYNDGTGDKQLKLTTKVQDCNCCGAYISATQWKEFMCHNLGADTSVDPHTPSVGLNGAYIQWGRRGPNTTGDSSVDWRTAANDGSLGFVAPPTASNTNAAAITGWVNLTRNALDWNSGTEGAPVKAAKDPCPTGYRVPTTNEWNLVSQNNSWARIGTWATGTTTPTTANNYNTLLQTSTRGLSLPAAGTYGSHTDNSSTAWTAGIHNRGRVVHYWSSNYPGANGPWSAFHSPASSSLPNNALYISWSYSDWDSKGKRAMPVRCIAQ